MNAPERTRRISVTGRGPRHDLVLVDDGDGWIVDCACRYRMQATTKKQAHGLVLEHLGNVIEMALR